MNYKTESVLAFGAMVFFILAVSVLTVALTPRSGCPHEAKYQPTNGVEVFAGCV